MFNQYSSSTHNNSYNTNNTNIQQVSGSLIKTNQDSVFLRFHCNSDMSDSILDVNPELKVAVKHNNYSCYDDQKYIYEERPVTVLQIMLAPNDYYICEVIIHWKKGDLYYKEPPADLNERPKEDE